MDFRWRKYCTFISHELWYDLMKFFFWSCYANLNLSSPMKVKKAFPNEILHCNCFFLVSSNSFSLMKNILFVIQCEKFGSCENNLKKKCCIFTHKCRNFCYLFIFKWYFVKCRPIGQKFKVFFWSSKYEKGLFQPRGRPLS